MDFNSIQLEVAREGKNVNSITPEAEKSMDLSSVLFEDTKEP